MFFENESLHFPSLLGVRSKSDPSVINKQIGKETRSDLTDEREAKLMAVGFVFETASPEGGDAHGNTYFSAQSCIPDEAFS